MAATVMRVVRYVRRHSGRRRRSWSSEGKGERDGRRPGEGGGDKAPPLLLVPSSGLALWHRVSGMPGAIRTTDGTTSFIPTSSSPSSFVATTCDGGGRGGTSSNWPSASSRAARARMVTVSSATRKSMSTGGGITDDNVAPPTTSSLESRGSGAAVVNNLVGSSAASPPPKPVMFTITSQEGAAEEANAEGSSSNRAVGARIDVAGWGDVWSGAVFLFTVSASTRTPLRPLAPPPRVQRDAG